MPSFLNAAEQASMLAISVALDAVPYSNQLCLPGPTWHNHVVFRQRSRCRSSYIVAGVSESLHIRRAPGRQIRASIFPSISCLRCRHEKSGSYTTFARLVSNISTMLSSKMSLKQLLPLVLLVIGLPCPSMLLNRPPGSQS